MDKATRTARQDKGEYETNRNFINPTNIHHTKTTKADPTDQQQMAVEEGWGKKTQGKYNATTKSTILPPHTQR